MIGRQEREIFEEFDGLDLPPSCLHQTAIAAVPGLGLVDVVQHTTLLVVVARVREWWWGMVVCWCTVCIVVCDYLVIIAVSRYLVSTLVKRYLASMLVRRYLIW